MFVRREAFKGFQPPTKGVDEVGEMDFELSMAVVGLMRLGRFANGCSDPPAALVYPIEWMVLSDRIELSTSPLPMEWTEVIYLCVATASVYTQSHCTDFAQMHGS